MPQLKAGGIALPTTLLIAAVIVVIGSFLAMQGGQSLTLVRNDLQSQACLDAADAGLSSAIDQVMSNPTSYASTSTLTSAGVSMGTTDYSYTYGDLAHQLTESVEYSLTVWNNSTGTVAVTTSNGVAVQTGEVYILATGSRYQTGHPTRILRQRYAAELMNVPSLYNGAVIESVGNVTFNVSALNTITGNLQTEGSMVGVIGSGSVAVNVTGNTYAKSVSGIGVSGTEYPAPTNPAWAIAPTPNASLPVGTSDAASSGAITPGSYNNLTITAVGGGVTLEPGDYAFNNITATGVLSSAVNVASRSAGAAPTRIFLYGSMTDVGVLSSGSAVNFQVIEQGTSYTGRSIQIIGVGTGNLCLGIDAPQLPVSLSVASGTTFQGGIITSSLTGGILTLNNISFDQSLNAMAAASATLLTYTQY